jgi:hypothetical protein
MRKAASERCLLSAHRGKRENISVSGRTILIGYDGSIVQMNNQKFSDRYSRTTNRLTTIRSPPYLSATKSLKRLTVISHCMGLARKKESRFIHKSPEKEVVVAQQQF